MSQQVNRKLRIGITIGDINGIGPELIIRAFQDSRLKELCVPVLYGSSRVINIYKKILKVNKFHYSVVQKPAQAQLKKLNVIECIPNLERIEIGEPSEQGGKAAFLSVKRAVEDAQHGQIDALVTLPVDKSTFQIHEKEFQGHTEYLAKAFGVEDNLMFMVFENFRVGLVTNHVPVKDISRNISQNQIIKKVRIMHKSLIEDFNISRPVIAVLGLNPHAGDNGLLGQEEEETIIPALESLRKEGILIQGPYPADGLFGSMQYQRFDGIMAMFHDQGLIPFKLISGYAGVNFTAGIPFIRTSPDHGVAYDLVGKEIASTESLLQSMYTAIDIYRKRTTYRELAKNALPVSSHQTASEENEVKLENEV
ncbi:MAG: 4-hydroxythreonine-4-phosphate dehydrogenase PdxA [Bacteroidota bacterium]